MADFTVVGKKLTGQKVDGFGAPFALPINLIPIKIKKYERAPGRIVLQANSFSVMIFMHQLIDPSTF